MRKNFHKFSDYKELIIYGIALIGLSLIIYKLFFSIYQNLPKPALDIIQAVNPLKKEEKPDNIKYLTVYIAGEIQNPGVYKLPEGNRIVDLIKEAKVTTLSSLCNLNLAEKLIDGEKITIYSINEPGGKEGDVSIDKDVKPAKVNLNSATSEELQKIPGIGETYAENIISHRTAHGSFGSFEELLNVKGIGSKRLERIKEYAELGHR